MKNLNSLPLVKLFFFFLNVLLLIFQRQRGREKERNIDWLSPAHLLPGTCPDLESNWQPPGSWDDAQPTGHNGQGKLFKCILFCFPFEISFSYPTICLSTPHPLSNLLYLATFQLTSCFITCSVIKILQKTIKRMSLLQLIQSHAPLHLGCLHCSQHCVIVRMSLYNYLPVYL